MLTVFRTVLGSGLGHSNYLWSAAHAGAAVWACQSEGLPLTHGTLPSSVGEAYLVLKQENAPNPRGPAVLLRVARVGATSARRDDSAHCEDPLGGGSEYTH